MYISLDCIDQMDVNGYISKTDFHSFTLPHSNGIAISKRYIQYMYFMMQFYEQTTVPSNRYIWFKFILKKTHFTWWNTNALPFNLFADIMLPPLNDYLSFANMEKKQSNPLAFTKTKEKTFLDFYHVVNWSKL